MMQWKKIFTKERRNLYIDLINRILKRYLLVGWGWADSLPVWPFSRSHWKNCSPALVISGEWSHNLTNHYCVEYIGGKYSVAQLLLSTISQPSLYSIRQRPRTTAGPRLSSWYLASGPFSTSRNTDTVVCIRQSRISGVLNSLLILVTVLDKAILLFQLVGAEDCCWLADHEELRRNSPTSKSYLVCCGPLIVFIHWQGCQIVQSNIWATVSRLLSH